jgi:hypothetical protein
LLPTHILPRIYLVGEIIEDLKTTRNNCMP